MRRADRILVVGIDNERLERSRYVLRVLSNGWREEGISVDATDQLIEPTGPDVLVFAHSNLTVTPPKQAALLNGCARVINRSVTDISKRLISRHRIIGPRHYEGPVIVKTDRNYGGKPEIRTAAAGVFQRRLLGLGRRLPWSISGLLSPHEYRIYDHPRLVPGPVWYNPRLIVEKFLPEREGNLYCLRQYLFLGPCEINIRSLGPDPLVKSGNVVRREILQEAPQAVRDYRAKLGFDFGKFDYVMHEGKPIVFDANRTPTYDPASKAGSVNSLIARLAPGIFPFLGE